MKELIQAVRDFQKAYTNLRFYWDRGPISMEDTKSIGLYPFQQSFDELDVYDWTNATIAELRSKMPPLRKQEGLSAKDIHMLQQIIRREEDDIGYLSIEEVKHLKNTLEHISFTRELTDFIEYMDKSMPPDMPNDTPERQAAVDEAWDKFYKMDFIIHFGDRAITIPNGATVYNGIYQTLKEELEDYV